MPGQTDPKTHGVAPEEIAKLWLSENAVVNQKTSYFIAASAFLASAMVVALNAASQDKTPAFFVAFCGLFFSVLTLSSIGRTCAYREHLRVQLMRRSDDYRAVLSPERFPWYARISSSFVLQTLPAVVALLWLIVLVYVFANPFKP